MEFKVEPAKYCAVSGYPNSSFNVDKQNKYITENISLYLKKSKNISDTLKNKKLQHESILFDYDQAIKEIYLY